MGQAEMGFRHAHRQLVKSQPGVILDLFLGFRVIIHSIGTVNLPGDDLDLFLDRQLQADKGI